MDYKKETKLFWRIWFYFRRGHSSYLGFLVGLVTFIIVFYKLSLDSIPLLKSLFPQMWMFVIVFAVVYASVTILIGWQDMKKGSYQTETRMTLDMHPRVKEQYEMIKRIEQRLDRIEKRLKK